MVFLKESVRMEDIILERLHIDTVQSDQAVSPQYVDRRGDDSIGARYVSSKTTQVGRSLLQVAEVLCQELDRVFRSVF